MKNIHMKNQFELLLNNAFIKNLLFFSKNVTLLIGTIKKLRMCPPVPENCLGSSLLDVPFLLYFAAVHPSELAHWPSR